MKARADIKFCITNSTKTKLPSLDFRSIKERVLGKNYDLSLNIVGTKKIKELNKKYRNIDEPTDILSFPLDKKTGEIYINPEWTNKKAKKFGRDFPNFFAFLFIHGLVHLIGYDHSSKMESIEKDIREEFCI
ncbi:MAG: rRNA maturation RNase YbeY [bacterium]|nr:rRNA maturation RNase YbeY [bacterium]